VFLTWMLICALGGLGLYLIATGQEVVLRPKPDLRAALRRLSVEGSFELERERAGLDASPLYRLTLLEKLVRPVAEDAGRLIAGLARHLGFGAEEWERRLAQAGQTMTVSQYLGQKLVAGVAGFLVFPVANVLDVTFFGPWHFAFWLGGFVLGFVFPDWLVEARVRARRRQIELALPAVLDLMSISVSAGMGLEQALGTVASQGEGVLLDELKRAVREMSLGEKSAVDALGEAAARSGVPEFAGFAGSLRSALLQGTQLGDTLRVQAEAVRERRRVRLIEEGGRATAKMLIPVGFLILPAYFLVILFPAAMQIMGLAG